jgi:hypothetical protein
MSFQIDQNLSLMIPRVFPQWIDEQKIIDIFHQQHIGRVYKVSITRLPEQKKRNYPIYQAFIYFSAWYETDIAFNFQQRIFGPRAQARVVYDDPWFWVVFENTNRRLSNNDKRLIRIAYQTYLNEQLIVEQIQELEESIVAQDKRIQDLEESIVAQDKRIQSETLHFWASDPVAVSTPMSWNRLTEEFAMKTLGAELELTETAISVAEAALDDPTELAELELTDTAISVAESALAYDAVELGAELDLTETAISVAEAALAEDMLYCCRGCEEAYVDDRYYY